MLMDTKWKSYTFIFLPLTYKSLLLLQFAASKCSKLDPNKGCEHGMITIRMIKLCGGSIFKPLENACKSCLNQMTSLVELKKANIV